MCVGLLYRADQHALAEPSPGSDVSLLQVNGIQIRARSLDPMFIPPTQRDDRWERLERPDRSSDDLFEALLDGFGSLQRNHQHTED